MFLELKKRDCDYTVHFTLTLDKERSHQNVALDTLEIYICVQYFNYEINAENRLQADSD